MRCRDVASTLALLVTISTSLAAPRGAHAQDAASWYDAAPLIEHLRSEQREGAAARAGASRLEELPLYDLHMSIDDELRGFGLREVIYVTNDERAPWREVVLRVFIDAVGPPGEGPLVSMVGGECLDGASCTIEQSAPSVIRVRLARPLAPGGHLRVQLDLQGRTREIEASRTTMAGQAAESMAGMMGEAPGAGSGDYGLLARGDGIGSFAQFFAVLARRERGRWVEGDGGTLGDLGTDAIANVRARIVVPRAMQVVTSGVETGSVGVRDAAGRAPRREVTVVAGMVRDFAVLVGPTLESAARDVGGVTVRSWYLPAERAAGRRVLETAASALALYERRFGAYPYVELDVVEAPIVGGAGGVEFSGLVTVASMFYRPSGLGMLGGLGGLGALGGGAGGGADAAAEITSAMIELVTAHEVAHQWWHGIVGSDSRAHPWVDESLAQWSALLWVEERYGAERARLEGDRQVAMNYRMMRMMGLPDGAVDRAASELAPPMAYAGLVYGKGPYLYEALRRELGDEALFTGLRAYVERHRFGMAPGRGPIDTLATGRHAPRVRALARRWLDERHGDEDLGGGDPGDVIGAMMPPELRDQLRDPAMQGLLRQMVRGMLGAGGSEGAEGALPGGDASDADAARMMREMERVLGSLPDTSSP